MFIKGIFCCANLAQFLYVGKELSGIGKMFVNIVKVLYEHLAPIVETVERLGTFFALGSGVTAAQRVNVHLVQFAHKQNGVANGKVCVLLEQFAHTHVSWTPQWCIVVTLEQVTVEEEPGSFVWEDNCYIFKISIEPFIYIVGIEF